jgi:transcriptional regulator with XRE-family HTH domain
LPREQVAEGIGIKAPGYAHYESGRNTIPVNNLVKLARLLRTTVGDLLGENDAASLDTIRMTGLSVEEMDEVFDLVSAFVEMRRRRRPDADTIPVVSFRRRSRERDEPV